MDTREFGLGDVVHTEEPFITFLDPTYLGKYCSRCLDALEGQADSYKCKGCDHFIYCSANCKAEDREFHQYECKYYTTRSESITFAVACALRLYVILQHRSQLLEQKFNFPGGVTKTYMSLKCPDEEKLAKLTIIRRILDALANDVIREFIDREKIFPIVSRFFVHSTSIKNAYWTHDIGLGLYINAASTFEHSCTPNAVPIFNGPKMEIRAMRAISAPERPKIAIVPIEEESEYRGSKLQERLLRCNCELCSEGPKQIEYDETCRMCKNKYDYFQAFYFLESAASFNLTETYKLKQDYLETAEKVYGQYHPLMSNEKVDCYFLTIGAGQNPPFTREELLAEMNITHGENHRLTQNFVDLCKDFDLFTRQFYWERVAKAPGKQRQKLL